MVTSYMIKLAGHDGVITLCVNYKYAGSCPLDLFLFICIGHIVLLSVLIAYKATSTQTLVLQRTTFATFAHPQSLLQHSQYLGVTVQQLLSTTESTTTER